jgi:hypothetical protein
LSTNPILEGDRLAIGNARRVSATEADGFAGIGPRDDEVWQRCLQIGPTWLSESGDGSELELQWPWGAPDKHRLLTAQCGDGAITIGDTQSMGQRTTQSCEPCSSCTIPPRPGRSRSFSAKK